jgi:hypothetical protein
MWRVVRRLGLDPVTTTAGLVAVLLSLVVVATGPIYSDAVTLASLRRQLAEEPVRSSTVTIGSDTPAELYDHLDEIVVDRARRATSSTGAEIIRTRASGSYEYAAASDELVALVVLRSVDGIHDHATLTAGDWPSAGDAADAPAIAVDARSAAQLGIGLGDRFDLAARRDPGQRLRPTVVGIYEIDDPVETYWAAAPSLVDGVVESTQFRTWSFVASSDAVIGSTTPRIQIGWFVEPDLSGVGPDDLETLGRRTGQLDTDLARDVEAAAASLATTFSEPDVDTGLPEALADADRSLTVTRSGVLAITLQLAVLAGYALALTARLVAESRRTELAVLRARGASPAQMVRRSVAEALVLTAPAALVAPWLATVITGALSRVGPLASSGLAIEPRPLASANIAVALAAVITVILLALPTFRLAQAAQRDADARRDRARSTVQRAGVDIAIVVLAGLAIWQLTTLGDARAAEIRGRFGVDPLLVVAPALGLFAGAFVALRVVPGVARLAELALARTRSAVLALASWQVARRPTRYARAALLLIMGVALGVFTTTYESTWERSQNDQATHQVGADVRVEPDRRTNASIEDLHLLAGYLDVEDVTAAVPVVRRAGALPNSERPATLVGLDASTAADVVLPTGDRNLTRAFEELADGRANLPSIATPPGTVRIDLRLGATDLTPDETVTDETVEATTREPAELKPVAAQVFVVLSDGDGLLHRRRAGELVARDGPATVSILLPTDDPIAVAPVPPVGLVDIELRFDVPGDRNRTIRVEVSAIDAVDAAGARTGLDADSWSLRTSVVGALDERVGLAASETERDALVSVDIATGRSRFGALATYGIGPAGARPPTRPPVVVSRSWFEANRRQIGDTVALPGASDRAGRIVGTVDDFPTITPDDSDIVIADLPTLQASRYELGQPIAEIGEVWLATGPDPGAVGDRLGASPYDAVSVAVRDELADRLLSDPPAVGTIGVLTVGFVAAAAFAVIGFLVTATVSARDRANEFALLRALGLSSRQLVVWTVLEQAALIVLSLVIGTAIGLGLGAVLLPAVSLTPSGDDVFPPVEIVQPWGSIVVVQAIVLSGLVVAVLGITFVLRRLAIARQLRAGST